MKKILSLLSIVAIASIIGSQSANAFDWSRLNPAYWGHCPRCEKKCDPCKPVKKCDPCKNIEKKCPCETGAAAPCNPCNTTPKVPCEPCEQLQNMSK